MTERLPARHWLIVGLMGSGKTTVGALLAKRAGRIFVDNDQALFEMTGRTARELRQELGTSGLHRIERRAIRAALARTGPAVIAAAASVVDDPETRELMEGLACVAWLDVPSAVLATRVTAQGHRPLTIAPRRQLEAQRAAREPLFAAVADIVVDGCASPAEIVDDLLPRLRDCRAG